MIKAMVMVMIMAINAQTATVVETYNDIMLVEVSDGNLCEYKFDGMTDREKYAKKVVVINDRVVVIQ